MTKVCGICGHTVSHGVITCPQCGRGVFESTKVHHESTEAAIAHANFSAKIVCFVSKAEVLGNDTSRVVWEIDQQVQRFLLLDQELADLPVEEKVAKGPGLIARAPPLSFGISGYEDDQQPLWAFDEARNWAWVWFRQQPYCILLLEGQSRLLLSLLCLGGFMSRKNHGFLPDFRSARSAEFRSLFESSAGILLDKYENPWLLGAFAISRHADLLSQFRDIQQERNKKWWQVWK